jgi:hypothetical protein
MGDLIVEPYERQHCERWDEFVNRSKNGTFLLRRGFMEYHAHRFADASVFVTNAAGNLLALFPANRTDTRLTSHAGLSYGGMVCDQTMGAPLAIDIFQAWFAYWQDRGIAEIVYKSIPPFYHRTPADEDRYALFYHGATLYRRDLSSVVDLDHPGPVQHRRQRGMRKAKHAGLTVRESNELEAFHRVLSDNLKSRHQRDPVHNTDELLLLQTRFPNNIRLFAVYSQSILCAGALLFCCGQAIHAQYIASSEGARQEGALDLLFLTLIEMFRGAAKFFDFGNSNENDGRYLNRGLCEFKEGFGARAIVQDFFRIELGEWQRRSLNA